MVTHSRSGYNEIIYLIFNKRSGKYQPKNDQALWL